MLTINENHVKVFEAIKQRLLSTTDIPRPGNWTAQTNNELWLKLLAQVMVVGSSTPFDRFKERPDLQHQVSYTTLTAMERHDEVERTINHVLRAIGTRCASADRSKCSKDAGVSQQPQCLQRRPGWPERASHETVRSSR